MTITINLEPEKEARLRRKAARAGRPVEQLVQDFVTQGLDKSDAEEHEAASVVDEPTLAELFAGRTGLVNSREAQGEAIVTLIDRHNY
jgi:plasmid stability protein